VCVRDLVKNFVNRSTKSLFAMSTRSKAALEGEGNFTGRVLECLFVATVLLFMQTMFADVTRHIVYDSGKKSG